MKIQRVKKQCRGYLDCEVCSDEIKIGKNFFLIENRDGEVILCCPECAAVYLAETIDAVSHEYEWEDNA